MPSKKTQTSAESQDHHASPKEETRNEQRRQRKIYRTRSNRPGIDKSEAKFTYTIQNHKKMLKTRQISQSILKERLKGYLEEKEVEKVDEDKKEEEGEDQKYPKRSRYYDILDGSSQRKIPKCHRCGEKGHISKNCLEQRNKVKCYFCLKSHHYNLCEAAVECYRCGEMGHIQYECDTKESDILKCKYCKKKGHKESNCGGVIFKKAPKDSSLSEVQQLDLGRIDTRDVICLNKCEKQTGHFSCYHTSKKKEYPYQKFLQNEEEYEYSHDNRTEESYNQPSYE